MTTIMVVDDHPMWRDGVGRDLTEHGFEVVATADSVAAAANRAAATKPDVVLMDMHLPDGNGAQATVAVLEHSPDPDSRPVRVLRARGRAGSGQGRCQRIPGEVGEPS